MHWTILVVAAVVADLVAGVSYATLPKACRTCPAACGTAVSECVNVTVASCPTRARAKAHRCRVRAKRHCHKAIVSCCKQSCRQTGTPVCCGAPSTTTTTLAGGTNPCFTDGGDGTVHDSCTGLQWEKKEGAKGVHNDADLHNVNNVYPWAGSCRRSASVFCQPDSAAAATCTALADGASQEGCSECPGGDYDPVNNPSGTGPCQGPSETTPVTTVWVWLNQLNAANFAGHNDWRVPSQAGRNSCPPGQPNCTTTATPRELETIVKGAPGACDDGPPCYYAIFGVPSSLQTWSASTGTSDQRYAWLVNFFTGMNEQVTKSYGAASVRAVRTDR
jgi:uncharacterized protein DUF1566